MGIFNKKKGLWNCDEIHEDGSRTCRRAIIDQKTGQKFATGTEITIGVDEHCEPIFTGDVQTLMDGDDEKIENIAKRMTGQCKKERGL